MSNELKSPPPPEGWIDELPTTDYAWMSEGIRHTNGLWTWLLPVFTKITCALGQEPQIELLESSAVRDAGDTFRSYDGNFIWKPVAKPARPPEPTTVRFRVTFVDDENNECDDSFETRNDRLFPWFEDALKIKSSGNENDEWEIPRELMDRVEHGVKAFNTLYETTMKVVWL